MKWISLSILGMLCMASSCAESGGDAVGQKQLDMPDTKKEQQITEVHTIEEIGNPKGEVTIEGITKLDDLNGKRIYLYQTEGKDAYRIDSTVIKNNAFSFKKREYAIGFYSIGDDISNRYDFIINPEESSVLNVIARNGSFKSSLQIPNSQENRIWRQYYGKESQLNSTIRTLRRQKKGAQDPGEIESRIEQAGYDLEDFREEFVKQNPMTYAGKIANHLVSHSPASRSKFWNDIDFADDSYTRSKVLLDRVQAFMRAFSGGKDAGFYNCIDELVTIAKDAGNDLVVEHVLGTVMTGFWESGKEGIAIYVLDNYINEETCGADISDYMVAKAEGFQKLRVGNVPPDFDLPKLGGGNLKLSKVVSENEYTLLFFWASWCHKCEQEVPIMNQDYPSLSKKGFEVVSYSVDTQDATWKKGIAEKNPPGEHVCEFKGWESSVAKNYRITASPTYYLLDKDMKIVLKPERFFEVRDFLAGKL